MRGKFFDRLAVAHRNRLSRDVHRLHRAGEDLSASKPTRTSTRMVHTRRRSLNSDTSRQTAAGRSGTGIHRRRHGRTTGNSATRRQRDGAGRNGLSELCAWGPGHIPGTGIPGYGGNAGIAAHRDSFFRALSKIEPNDQHSDFKRSDKTVQYRVVSTDIVTPDNVGAAETVQYGNPYPGYLLSVLLHRPCPKTLHRESNRRFSFRFPLE